MKPILLFLTLLFAPSLSLAAVEPDPSRKDPRIKNVTYSESDVVELTTNFFRYTMIEFADHESYVYHFVGEPLAWDVQPKEHRLFVKPTDYNPDTNMTVVTDKRVYLFKLSGLENDEMKRTGKTPTYALRFKYPHEKTLAMERKAEAIAQLSNQTVIPGHTIDPEKLNHNYGYKGDSSFKPVQVFDDGVFTYFQFEEHSKIPSIFFVDDIVGGSNREQLINYHNRGNYIVVERVGSQFALRIDDQIICVYNRNLYKEKKKNKSIASRIK